MKLRSDIVHPSLQGPTWSSTHQGDQTRIYDTVQWSFSRIPNRTQVQLHRLIASNPRIASPQRGGMCTNHIQVPLHCGDLFNRPGLLHARLGLLLRTGGDYTKLTLNLETEPQTLRVYPIKFHIQLQQNSHALPRYHNPSARQTARQGHLGTTWPRSMVYMYVYDILYMSYIINTKDSIRTSIRHNRNLSIPEVISKPFSSICGNKHGKWPHRSPSEPSTIQTPSRN